MATYAVGDLQGCHRELVDLLEHIGFGDRDKLWLVGEDGGIWRYDGVDWSQQQSGTDAKLRAITGTSATDVWVAGSGATVLHFDERL